ncbi:MAG: hypothetical protein WDM94_06580 [Bauldia sp.]
MSDWFVEYHPAPPGHNVLVPKFDQASGEVTSYSLAPAMLLKVQWYWSRPEKAQPIKRGHHVSAMALGTNDVSPAVRAPDGTTHFSSGESFAAGDDAGVIAAFNRLRTVKAKAEDKPKAEATT